VDLSEYALKPLRKDEPFLLYRGVQRSRGVEGPSSILLLALQSPRPALANLKQIEHEFALRGELNPQWAACPLAVTQHNGQTVLVLEDPGGEPLDRLIREPMKIGQFLRTAAALAAALGRLHGRGLIHKDIKPSNILVNSASGEVWLTGFGIASRLPRERQSPVPPDVIAGTLAYMAPEQTGRMNRSLDSRSDLYSLGITLYEALTGSLPFTASSPMEWVHCHIARDPIPPSVRVREVPNPVSAILLKLLSKTAEERYQTAVGAESDFRRCLSEWESGGRIGDFTLGKGDTPDRLMIPERLYGRGREIGTLLSAFDRIVAGGRPELVLVSGYSGIGKSAVVNELHKALVPPRGLFASGKFDQYKRDIPYATLAQAFQSLIRPLLSKSEEELSEWRDTIRKAIEPNGLLLVDLVPELEHILGEQPPVAELPPQDAQGRFQLVVRRFIGVFARPEHPLALFLDDLQWLDAATLDLLEDLLTRSDLKYLLLIGAYRDNEVSPIHPLMRKLEAIRQAGAIVQTIMLTPLDREDLRQLLADSLHSETEQVSALAELIREKTSGNPFFAIQFLSTLVDENLLTFDYDHRQWSWNLSRIHAKGYTDNVVDLMVGKLNRLSVETQHALQHFACMGNDAEFDMLQRVYGDSLDEVHNRLWEAVRTGLIFRSENSYRFLHDRVQEAAYSSIPQELRAENHLRIGTLLAEHTPPQKLEETIFEIVNQLNRGSHLIDSVGERERLAGLNLIAAKRAKVSTAYPSALRYLSAGRALLTEAIWELNYELVFSIESLMAECELLTADLALAEDRLTILAHRARGQHNLAVITRLRLTLYTTLDQSDLCVDTFLEYLRRGGTVWSRHPTRDEVLREYDLLWTLVGARQIEELLDLPLMTNPDVLDSLDVFTEMVHPAFFYDENLSSLVVCRMVSLSLEYGNCDASCFGYVWFAMFAGPRFNNYRDGYRFGELGFGLVEKRGLVRYQARTYLTFATLTPWAKHAASARGLIRRAFDAAYRVGDLTFSAYSWEQLITNCLMVGDSLSEVQCEAENGIAFAKKSRFGLVVDICSTQLGLIRTLRGLTPKFGSFDDDEFDELRTESHLASNPVLALAEFFYWTRKLQGRYFAGDYAVAVVAAEKAQRLIWTASSQVTSADFPFYGALAHAASWDSASSVERQRHFDVLSAHHKQLEVWAEHCPANFENRAALVGAEIARIEGRTLAAEQLYEDSIHSAHANSFVHNEALANEHAARFYAARGFSTIADAYLRNARDCYKSWGAIGKVWQLEANYPQLRAQVLSSSLTATIDTPVVQFDIETVVKTSQTLSSEINLPNLIEKLMQLAVEHAGAERGLLILMHEDGPRIEAEAIFGRGSLEISSPHKLVTPEDLPSSTLQYVLRTRERVLIGDASVKSPESEDKYFRNKRLRSVLCLPILKQKVLVGALYLENSLTAYAFTSGRVAVLDVIASQAAISLDNGRLYRDLAERESRIRRLVDANIIGIFIWELGGRILETNDAFLTMIGYDRDDVAVLTLHWTDLTPPEWRERDEQLMLELKTNGTLRPFEKEFFRKDGSRVPVLVGVATFEATENQGVAYVVDLSERKRAEEALSESEYQSRLIVDNIPGLVALMSATGDIDTVNRQLLEYFGQTLEKLRGWGTNDTIHPEDLPHVIDVFSRSIAAGSPYEILQRFKRADGVYRWFQNRGFPLRDANGIISRWCVLLTDIDDQKRAEEALNKARSELAHVSRVTSLSVLTASIAHEINQPLTAVVNNGSACLRLLATRNLEPEVLRGALQGIVADATRASEVLARIRAFIKKEPTEMSELDINEVIREVLVLAGREIYETQVLLDPQLTPDLPFVSGDRVQLQQVLLNLIMNGIEAMAEEPTRSRLLGVRSRIDESGYVQVAVSDSGSGLGLEMERVFTPFFTTKANGMGMGLSISRSLIESHGGQLWATPNSPHGAVFSFTLPAIGGTLL
jgi:PAS domain S-box-containing protein